MCLAQGPQRSDAGEARTRGLSVSSQALYHWATALPLDIGKNWKWGVVLFKSNCIILRHYLRIDAKHIT